MKRNNDFAPLMQSALSPPAALGCSRRSTPLAMPWLRTLLTAAVMAQALLSQAPDAQSAATLTTLHSFGPGEGQEPNGLVLGYDGNFYGTTIGGGAGNFPFLRGCGTIFRIAPDGTFTTLYSFSGTDGANPGSYNGVDSYCISPGLVQGSDTNFYGITARGGIGYTGDCNNGWDGANGSGYGTIFRMGMDGTLTTLVFFDGTNGAVPSSILQGEDGNFYGTTMAGLPFSVPISPTVANGTVFKMTPDGTLSTLAVFNGTNGASPRSFIQGKDGAFYGTTDNGGTYFNGTVFKVTPDGTLTTLASFSRAKGPGAPYSLMQASDGSLYGTMAGGGKLYVFENIDYYLGTVFRLSLGGTPTNLVLFDRINGTYPVAPVMEGTDGNLYGSTYSGGTGTAPGLIWGPGLLFETTHEGSLTTLFQFNINTLDGANPRGGLVQASDGSFYGTTSLTGPNSLANGSYGTVFRLTVPGAERPKIINTALAGGSVGMTWLALAGRSYQLQFANDLTQTNWNNSGVAITATNTVMTSSDSTGLNPQGFYRVVLLPP